MVYLGKPSTGCRNCRQRRIKCDETRPSCIACIRTNRTCPGYPDPFDLVHRDHNSFFKKGAKPSTEDEKSVSSTKRGSSQSLAESKELTVTDGGASSPAKSKILPSKISANSLPTWPPPLGPADLCVSMEDTVVPLWFNAYLYLPHDPSVRGSFMEFLPGMYSNAEHGSALHLSTLAVGFFSLAAWTGQASLFRASERTFLKALPKIRNALQSSDSTDLDSMLVSILLLSIYEEMVATKDSELPMRAHLRGAVALINERKSKSMEQAPSTQVSHMLEAQIIKNSRSLANPSVSTPDVWPLLKPRDSSPKIVLTSIASEIVQLRQAWESIASTTYDASQVEEILRKANAIDINLVAWTYCLPEHWIPVAATIIPESVRTAGMYRNHCDCYTDIWIAVIWNTFRDCRILVQRIMLRCLYMTRSLDPDGRRIAGITLTIHKLANEVCASVPYFLGDQLESVRMKPGLVKYPSSETRPVNQTHWMSAPLMGAWHVFPYLRNLCYSDLGLPLEQCQWIQSQVNRILVIYFQR